MVSINDKAKCCGCSACKQKCPVSAISMKRDEEGFLYPQVNEMLCISCGLCDEVCPFLNALEAENTVPQVYAAKNKDSAVRYHSSSGGVFHSLARQILMNDGIVCGVAMSDDCKSAQHILVYSMEELYQLQGSKYIQSNIGEVYTNIKNILETGKYVLFSGTPCQINGLKSFLGKETENLLCVEVICHGVPSEKLWKKYVDYLEDTCACTLSKVYFRSKKYSWEQFGTSLQYKNRKIEFKFSFEDPYFRMFNSNFCLRPSCYDCKSKKENSRADITLGDFWHISDVIPSFNDDKGVSMVLVNTKLGKAYFEKILQENDIADVKVDYQTALKCNPAIKYSVTRPLLRDSFYKDLELVDFNTIQEKYVPKTIKIKLKATLLRLKLWRIMKKIQGGGNT